MLAVFDWFLAGLLVVLTSLLARILRRPRDLRQVQSTVQFIAGNGSHIEQPDLVMDVMESSYSFLEFPLR